MQYLLDKSMSDRGGQEAAYAGVLLVGLGYPRLRHSAKELVSVSHNAFVAEIIEHIANSNQTDLLVEASQKCGHCLYSDICELGGLFKAG